MIKELSRQCYLDVTRVVLHITFRSRYLLFFKCLVIIVQCIKILVYIKELLIQTAKREPAD